MICLIYNKSQKLMLSVWQGVAAVDWFVHKRNEYYCATTRTERKTLDSNVSTTGSNVQHTQTIDKLVLQQS